MRFKEFLTEGRQIVINNGAKYGQIVILAGGGASGKGFARNFYIDSNSYKVIDVDDLKAQFLKMSKKSDNYNDIKDVDLRKPNDVEKLHMWVKKRKVKDHIIDNIAKSNKNSENLPNIMLDVTFKDFSDVKQHLITLLENGYSSKNVHLVWVLQNYDMALSLNAKRSRVVPEHVLFHAHDAVAKQMFDIIFKGSLPKEINGSAYVVLNDLRSPEISDTGVKWIINNLNNKTIDDFSYVQIKKSGSGVTSSEEIKTKIAKWFVDNIPEKTKEEIFSKEGIH